MTPGPRSGTDVGGDDGAAAFAELFDTTFADMWRYVRRRVGSTSDADDVTAEVYAVAWRRKDELPPPDERRLWLFGVARNVVRNHHRSIFRRERLAHRLSAVAEAETVEPIERDDALWFALARLSPDDRDLLMMRAWEQLSIGDIASLLDCTPNAASLRLHKARGRLRTELTAEADDGAAKERGSSGHGTSDPLIERRAR